MVCSHTAETFERECVVDRTHTCEEHAYCVCSSCEWTSGSESSGEDFDMCTQSLSSPYSGCSLGPEYSVMLNIHYFRRVSLPRISQIFTSCTYLCMYSVVHWALDFCILQFSQMKSASLKI